MLRRMDGPSPPVTRTPAARRHRIGIVGAGRVGMVLGTAIDRAGWPVVAVASRDAGRRTRFLELVPGAVAVSDAGDLPELIDLVFLTVPDDAIESVAGRLQMRPGQAIVHTSGALPASILAATRVPGSAIASFHPLVPFADMALALAALSDSTIAIEGDAALVVLLGELARDLGAAPVVLAAAGKAAYHAAAVLAAGGFVALLDTIAELGRAAGLDEPTALATYVPLIRQGLANAGDLGIASALTGPFVRGDTRTVALHLDAIDRLAPDARALYAAAADRQIGLAMARGEVDGERAAAMRDLLEA